MKPIIIATGNQGKFEQTTNILKSLKVNTDQFLNLADLGITNDEPETDSLLDRAKQKALHCLSKIKPEDYSKYLCLVANDTGTKLPTLNLESAESKKIARQILAGELLKPGDPIIYVYSYVFVLLPSQKMLTTQTDIPFTYLGNPKGLTQIEGQNTMSQVKAIPGQSVPHSQIPLEEEIQYRLTYLKAALSPIIDQINSRS
jgi:hypothetical protein